MGTAKTFTSLHKITAAYSNRLRVTTEEQFQQTPSTGGWSYSEVYSHIFDASLLSLQAMEDCLAAKGKDKPTAFMVKLILFFGAFPPMKFKVPKVLEGRAKVISKEEASIFIEKFLKQLDTDYKQIPRARNNIKTKHPRLGYLNATQWLRFTEIHLKHHLKQLQRIEKSFA